MNYSDLIKGIEECVKAQTQDKTALEYFSAEEIKQNFLKHAKHIINSDCVILSKPELLEKCKEYHTYIDYYPEHLPY